MANSGIYKIVDISTGDFYIGSTKNFKLRKKKHFNDLKNQKHHNNKIQAIYNKERVLSFEIYIICSVEFLQMYEQRCIDILKPKLNISIDTIAFMRGKKHSPETRKKMKENAKRGENSPSKRPEVRKKMSESSWMKTPEGSLSVSGENHAGVKLTKEQAIEILYSLEPTSVLARRYNIAQSVISRIRSGERWKCIRPKDFVPKGIPEKIWYRSGPDNKFYGKKHSVESRLKISGENAHKSKLKLEDVLIIRESKEPPKILAKKFNVCEASIRNIQKRKSWRFIDGLS